MNASSLQHILAHSGCEVRCDPLTRRLYATDASIYQIEPLGVAFPRSATEAAAVIAAAGENGVAVTPRGAGSGLVGGALGDGLIVDFARYNRRIESLDLERRTVRVQAGVVLDQLNDFLKPHGFCFGPDVATSSRATLGGMIANDSSGARTPFYGTTAGHVRALELVLADGSTATVGQGSAALATQQELADHLARKHAAELAARQPDGLVKRWPGYGLRRLVREPGFLPHILAGSEGTLAGIFTAELQIVPLPKSKGLGLIFFASVADALQATVELLDLHPVAIEHVDRVLFEQTRGQIKFRAARDLLELDAKPCEAFLIVEFYAEVGERLAALEGKRLGLRTRLLTNAAEMNLVWGLRKAGLSLLTGCPGSAKPVTCIEDVAVRPERLPEFARGVESILRPLGINACFYGHAASGLLHIRPVIDLHTSAGVANLRQIATEVSTLVRQFGGSLAAEHGVGIARTEFMHEQLGPELLGAMREIKSAFDPRGTFNPGKILGPDFSARPVPEYRIDTRLRLGAGYVLNLPFEPVLAFAAKDRSFVGNLEQCNGCGGCLKQAPTMCPTFAATGEESMSTRGRANVLRATLEGAARDTATDLLTAADLSGALESCLSCRACASECPSNVNLALLKAEMLHAKHRQEGVPFFAQVVSRVDLLGRIGCLAPGVANALLQWRATRWLLEKALGLAAERPLPRYAVERFDHWFASREKPKSASVKRGKVILWDDTFVRYHEPHIGRAAVRVLEAAGFEVKLPVGRKCCGRPAFSQGDLTEAARLGRHNLRLLDKDGDMTPILFLEPSCWSMFKEDYRELKLEGAERVATRCHLFESFLTELLSRDPQALKFAVKHESLTVHVHCHVKAGSQSEAGAKLLQRLPGRTVQLLDTGCCGMAGAFGAKKQNYELSKAVGAKLSQQLTVSATETTCIASGTSCRQQIEHLTIIRALHHAEMISNALE